MEIGGLTVGEVCQPGTTVIGKWITYRHGDKELVGGSCLYRLV